jgi:flagellar motility protein MotE (MotC chaperone)
MSDRPPTRLVFRGFAPRWLPATIGVLAGLLAMKSVSLVRAIAEPGPRPSWIASDARAAKPASPAPADGKATQAKEDPKPVTEAVPAEPPISQAERAVLLELRQRREELETRETAIREREALLAAVQHKLAERAEEMRALQARLETLDQERRKLDDQSWQGLVKLYETMKPREAAPILNELALPVLTQVVDRMKDAKAAAILAAMDPDRARQLTQELARLRTGSSNGARAVTPAVASPQVPAAKPTPTN